MNISFPKKLEDDLRVYCKDNKITISAYVSKCVEEKLMIDKYGDLNEIMFGKQEVKPKEPSTIKDESVDVVAATKTEQVDDDKENIVSVSNDKEDVIDEQPVINVNDKQNNRRRIRVLK